VEIIRDILKATLDERKVKKPHTSKSLSLTGDFSPDILFYLLDERFIKNPSLTKTTPMNAILSQKKGREFLKKN